MCAVLLIFAFLMSLLINVVERMIVHHNDQVANENETEEAFVTRKTE